MKKLLSIILAILMIVTTVPFAFAVEDYTYDEVTDTYTVYTFAGLETALTAGGNIILGADIIRDDTTVLTAVPENITAVLDLNGNTITTAPSVPGVNYEIINVNGNLTIKDSGINGTIDSTASSVSSCLRVEGGSLTIDAGNFICDTNLAFAVDVFSGNAVINGGAFTNFNVFDEGKAVINGGEFQSKIWTSGSLIINGGTFYGKEYTYNTFGGTFDIYGGEFHENPTDYVANGYEAVANENGTWTVVCIHTDRLVQVEAKAPTCTEIGWDAYEYCTACDYTTYVEKEALNHNFINGTCLNCGENKNIIGAFSPQIRFQRNADGSYADKFDVRTRATISDEDFTELVGATNEDASRNIKKVGFVYSISPETFSIDDAQRVAKGETISCYTDSPVKYVQDADGYYMFTCLVTDIPSTDNAYTLVSYAYICAEDADGNEKWYFMETQAEADFISLYDTYYPVACEKYGW